MTITAIDPGTNESAFVVFDGQKVLRSGFVSNDEMIQLATNCPPSDNPLPEAPVSIEMIASYGMAVGKEVFETCVLIGRLSQAFEQRGFIVRRVYRKDIKMHLCGSMKAKDANIRQALIDKHGPPGTKKAPGATYGISGHLWAALAVADYAISTHPKE